ncbi:MAG: hypothetical protein AB1750_10015, partial [Chloroflexota bacterium]
GFTLVAEAFHVEIPKGYIYFAMAFSVFVEVLNLRVRSKMGPVNLREAYAPEKPSELQPAPVPIDVAPTMAGAKSARKSAPKPKGKSATKAVTRSKKKK